MSCDHYRKMFDRRRQNLLPGDELRSLEEHLSGCAACREEWDVLLSIDEMASAFSAHDAPPDYFENYEQKLMERIDEEGIRAAYERKKGFFLFHPVHRLVSTAAVLLFISAVAVTIGLHKDFIPAPSLQKSDLEKVDGEKPAVELSKDSFALKQDTGKSAGDSSSQINEFQDDDRERRLDTTLTASKAKKHAPAEDSAKIIAEIKEPGYVTEGEDYAPEFKGEPGIAAGKHALTDKKEGITARRGAAVPQEIPLISTAETGIAEESIPRSKLMELKPGKEKLREIESMLNKLLETTTANKEFLKTQNSIKSNLPVLSGETITVADAVSGDKSGQTPYDRFNYYLDQISNIREPERSSAEYDAADKLQDYLGNAFYYLGVIYEQEYSDESGALDAYQKVISLYPENPHAPDAQFQVGELFYNQGKYRESYYAFRQVCDRFPENPKCVTALKRSESIKSRLDKPGNQ